MSTPEPSPRFWELLLGQFLELRLVGALFVGLVCAIGVVVAPFSLPDLPLPRAPIPVDAIPNIGDNQQIVFTEWPGRSPRDVEDQLTYPLTTALLGIPGVRTVRSASALGFSSIYVIFEDDIEFYWSRSRLLEKLASLPPGTLPDDAKPTLGPDATALGQVFWYTLEGHAPDGAVVGGWDPDELRAVQDWTVRYALQSVPGVAEVSSIGGFTREYQVDVDPEALRAHGVSLTQVADAVRRSNLDVGARTLEVNGVEYLIRGIGFVKSIEDLEETVVLARKNTPVRVRDVARVDLGPGLRRGALDDAGAPAVGGVVVVRAQENPLMVIDAVKERIAQLQAGLPTRALADGTPSQVTIVPFYDRSDLIHETLETLSTALWRQILITVLVVLVLMRDVRSSALVSGLVPVGVLATFAIMRASGVDANIMALGGIAIAIGTMVDISVVFVENIHDSLEKASKTDDRLAIVRRASAEVAPAVLTSVLTTVVSFLPVFGLTAAELRLFAPLALTKTIAMTASFGLALIILPGASLWVLRERPAAPQAPVVGLGYILRSAFRWHHARDALLMVLGSALVPMSPLVGLLFVGMGLVRFARPLLPLVYQSRVQTGEQVVVLLVIARLLIGDWMPLGHAAGWLANALLVGTILASVLGLFAVFERLYPRLLRWILEHQATFLVAPTLLLLLGLLTWRGADGLLAALPPQVQSSRPAQALLRSFPGLGSEYMPPFDEGAFLYMPTTMPHASIGEVLVMLADIDAAIAEIPEVDRVVGKLGRTDSALDPAPVSMIETLITFVPEYEVQDDGQRVRKWRDHIRSPRDIWNEIIAVAAHPGLTSAPWLMPIAARLVMLQSGMRAPMGVKVKGPSLAAIESFGHALETVLKRVPDLRSETVFADRVVGKPYLEISLDRPAIGRYGLSVVDVQQVLQVALGGATLTRTVEGRERVPVRVRYMREERDSMEALEQIFVTSKEGVQVPLSQLAHISYAQGPQVIKSEDTFPTSYVLFDKQPDLAEVDAVEAVKAAIEHHIASGDLVVPPGVTWELAGTYENQVRSSERLLLLLPVAVVLVFMLLYLQFRRVSSALIISSGVAVSVAGGFLLLALYNTPWFLNVAIGDVSLRTLFQVHTVNLSVAVWVGVIALIGIATDDGVVMTTLLRSSLDKLSPQTVAEVRALTLDAGIRRIRPCLMTTATTVLALLPVVTSQGRGSDIMVPMALPVLGGMTVELLTLFVVPVLTCAWEERRLPAPSPPTDASAAV